VNPGALKSRPGSMTVMKNDNASERAAALVNEALDVLQRAEQAPGVKLATGEVRFGDAV